jgi:hypothetical protein
MGIKIARFDILKSLENIWVTLHPVAMAGKWKAEHKKP